MGHHQAFSRTPVNARDKVNIRGLPGGPAPPGAIARADAAIGLIAAAGRFCPIPRGGNPAAQVAEVTVGGNWAASRLAAGALPGLHGFGSGDTKIGTTDAAGVHSRIGLVVIGSQAIGDSNRSVAHFGFAAEEVRARKVGGTPIALAAGINSDRLVSVDEVSHVTVNEV
jgi:hypothetical protein